MSSNKLSVGCDQKVPIASISFDEQAIDCMMV